MPRMTPLTTKDSRGAARTLLEGIEKKMGMVPNLMATMAQSPAVLEAYQGFSAKLARGALSAQIREQIALAVGEANQCAYCVAAHSALGRMAGLSDEEIADSRRGSSPVRQTEAALAFARKIVSTRGHVTDAEMAAVRDVGFDDGAIAEIVANVALNIFTNYFNHVAETEVDFPAAEPLATNPASVS